MHFSISFQRFDDVYNCILNSFDGFRLFWEWIWLHWRLRPPSAAEIWCHHLVLINYAIHRSNLGSQRISSRLNTASLTTPLKNALNSEYLVNTCPLMRRECANGCLSTKHKWSVKKWKEIDLGVSIVYCTRCMEY